MLRPAALIALLATLVLAPAASAADGRYAAPGGNGPEPCAAAAPCSLKKAIEDAPADGLEVVVEPGNYGYDSLIVMSKALDVHGVAGEPRPHLAPASGYSGQALHITAGGSPRVARLDVKSNQLPLYDLNPNQLLVEDVVLTGTQPGAFGALFETGGTRTIRNSVVRTVTDGSKAIVVRNGVLKLRNVTTYASGTGARAISAEGYCMLLPGQAVCSGGTQPEIDVLDTIAKGDGYALSATADTGSTAKITVGHSNFASQTPPTPGATIEDAGGNQSSPPLYQSSTVAPFHEASDSPTIDAGISDPLLGVTDYDGDPRILGGAVDMGADEFVPPASGTPDPGGGGGSPDPGPAPQPGADTTAPTLTDLAIAPATFRAASTGASAAAKTGATTVFTLSEPAMVSFRVERRANGRRKGRRCVKPTRRLRSHKRCARYLRVEGGFDRLGAAGPNGFRFSGRIGGRKLRPGRYRFVAMAADGAGNLSKPARTPFRIVRR